MFRERAIARKAVVSQEAEIAEAAVQLASLDQFGRKLEDHLDRVERSFADGRIVAPIAGIISTNLARVGQSLVAGTPIAEILDRTDIFVDWYVPNERLADPEDRERSLCAVRQPAYFRKDYGNPAACPMYIPEPSHRSRANAPRHRSRESALVRATLPPALNSTVYVHMHYTDFTAWIATMLVRLFGLGQM